MKLRILADSVRLRLSQSEVRRLAQGQRVEETTWFSASQRIVVSVESSIQIACLTAIFDGCRVAVAVPAAAVGRWAASDQVGIEAVQDTGEGRALAISVEKDFQCLHSSPAGNADAFANPRA